VHHQCGQRGQPHQDGVPVQNSGVFAELEIRPQRLKEVPGFVKRHSANHFAESRPEKHHQQEARNAENKIPKRDPYSTVKVVAEFNCRAAKNQ
jgi:hypothetical protein